MISTLHLLLIAVCFVCVIDVVPCLKCWKCIQNDCDTDPEYNYKAIRVTCKDGQSCLKVRYQMFDNVTHFDAITRTCSSGKCVATSENDYKACLNSERKYIVSGCSLRKCCDDKDFCNAANRVRLNMNRETIVLGILVLITTYAMT